MSVAGLVLMSSADGLGPGAGAIVAILFGGAVLGACVIGGAMVLVGLALFKRGRPEERANDVDLDLTDRR